MQRIDLNDNGVVEFEEFAAGMLDWRDLQVSLLRAGSCLSCVRASELRLAAYSDSSSCSRSAERLAQLTEAICGNELAVAPRTSSCKCHATLTGYHIAAEGQAVVALGGRGLFQAGQQWRWLHRPGRAHCAAAYADRHRQP